MDNPGETDLFTVSERVLGKLYESSSFGELTRTEQIFACVWELESDVNNGGFHQYYFNSAGDRAMETHTALRELGAPRFAEIVQRANGVFGVAGPSPDRSTRQAQLQALSDAEQAKLEELDDRFCEYPEDLESLLQPLVGKDGGF